MYIALKELAIQPIVISEVLKPGVVDLRSQDFSQRGPLVVDAVASLVAEEIRINGKLEVGVETECCRCLEKMQVPVKKNFDLFYHSSKTLTSVKRDEEIELKRPELDVGFYVRTGLEFNDTLRELILIEMPMKPVCRPDCRGLCLHCGANLNGAPCDCPAEEADPRWSELKRLKKI